MLLHNISAGKYLKFSFTTIKRTITVKAVCCDVQLYAFPSFYAGPSIGVAKNGGNRRNWWTNPIIDDPRRPAPTRACSPQMDAFQLPEDKEADFPTYLYVIVMALILIKYFYVGTYSTNSRKVSFRYDSHYVFVLKGKDVSW